MISKKISYKKVILSIIIGIFLTFAYIGSVYADVGSFESYDSGGSSGWSSSDWSSSDWSSSSWDDDDDYSWSSLGLSGSSGKLAMYGDYIIILVLVIIFVIVFPILKKSDLINRHPSYYYAPQPSKPRSEEILRKIHAVDELFNQEEFLAWSKDLFVKLQNQWMARDWEEIRYFETNELFEQHKNQIQGYIDKKQINMLERICVNYAKLYDFKQVGDKDILDIELNSSMIDYIIDEETRKVLMGNTVTRRTRSYKLTFIRKTGIKTKPGEAKVNTTNCPNCGAPTQITSSGKCKYCGSVITTGEYNWVLSNLEPLR